MSDSDFRPRPRVLRPFVPSPPGSPAVPRSPSPARSAPAVHRMPRPFTPSVPMPAVAPRLEPPIETLRPQLTGEGEASAPASASEAAAPPPSPLYEEAIASLAAFGTPDAPTSAPDGDTEPATAGFESGIDEGSGSNWEPWSETGTGAEATGAEPRIQVGAEEPPAGADEERPLTGHPEASAAESDAERTMEWAVPSGDSGVERALLAEAEAPAAEGRDDAALAPAAAEESASRARDDERAATGVPAAAGALGSEEGSDGGAGAQLEAAEPSSGPGRTDESSAVAAEAPGIGRAGEGMERAQAASPGTAPETTSETTSQTTSETTPEGQHGAFAAAAGAPVMSDSINRADADVPTAEPEPSELLAGAEFDWPGEARHGVSAVDTEVAAPDREAQAPEGRAAASDHEGATGEHAAPASDASVAAPVGVAPAAGASPEDSDAPAEAEEVELPAIALAEEADDWSGSNEAPPHARAVAASGAGEPVAGEAERPPLGGATPSNAQAAVVGALEELKEIEPWASPMTEERDPDPGSAIADALERLARRVREGSLVLPPDSDVHSDEGALAIALAALLRHSGR